jgi:hypothetical protein
MFLEFSNPSIIQQGLEEIQHSARGYSVWTVDIDRSPAHPQGNFGILRAAHPFLVEGLGFPSIVYSRDRLAISEDLDYRFPAIARWVDAVHIDESIFAVGQLRAIYKPERSHLMRRTDYFSCWNEFHFRLRRTAGGRGSSIGLAGRGVLRGCPVLRCGPRRRPGCGRRA